MSSYSSPTAEAALSQQRRTSSRSPSSSLKQGTTIESANVAGCCGWNGSCMIGMCIAKVISYGHRLFHLTRARTEIQQKQCRAALAGGADGARLHTCCRTSPPSEAHHLGNG